MANEEHVALLKKGFDGWNKWRSENTDILVDLSEAELSGADLHGANLSGAHLSRAELSGANLSGADLSKAYLSGVDLSRADLSRANLSGAELGGAYLHGADLSGADLSGVNLIGAILIGVNLSGACLSGAYLSGTELGGAELDGADLSGADLSGADLSGADLSRAVLRGADLKRSTLVNTNLSDAILTGCRVFGASVWNVQLDGAEQKNLVITDADEPVIIVDSLGVAQFIYLLLHNQKIRDVINTITSKAVLILGRFTPERKAVLDAIRDELRKYDYLPIMIDFDKPISKNLTETISTLAHLARFVIADITDAKSIPQELQRIVPRLPSLPVQPLILSSQYEQGMFQDLRDYPWVLVPHRYDSLEDLLAALPEKVIRPAVVKAQEIEDKRKDFEERLGV